MPDFERDIRELVRVVVREELAAAPKAAEYVTVVEYARRHSISETTTRLAIAEGRLPAIRIGRLVRVRPDAPIGRPASKRDAAAAARSRLLVPKARR